MADRIELTGLRVRGRHGVLPEERRLGQDFIVDLVCWLDLTAASESDDLNDTVNYAELAQIAHDVVTGEPLDLIEAVAGRIASAAMERFAELHAVEVTVHKPAAPIPLTFDDVAVVARRSRKAHGAALRAAPARATSASTQARGTSASTQVGGTSARGQEGTPSGEARR